MVTWGQIQLKKRGHINVKQETHVQNKCLLWAGITCKEVDNITRSFAFSLYWFMVIKAQKCVHFGGYFILKSNNDGQGVKCNIWSSNECPEAILKGLNRIIPGQQGEVTDSTHMKSTWHERKRKKKNRLSSDYYTRFHYNAWLWQRAKQKLLWLFYNNSTQISYGIAQTTEYHSQLGKSFEVNRLDQWWQALDGNATSLINRSLTYSVYLRFFHQIWNRLKLFCSTTGYFIAYQIIT